MFTGLSLCTSLPDLHDFLSLSQSCDSQKATELQPHWFGWKCMSSAAILEQRRNASGVLKSSECVRLSLISPVQHLFPEKLSRCQWLPVMSEAVVKCPCVRLPLATITTAVIIVLAVFNLVRFYTLGAKRRHTHTLIYAYTYICVCVCMYIICMCVCVYT